MGTFTRASIRNEGLAAPGALRLRFAPLSSTAVTHNAADGTDRRRDNNSDNNINNNNNSINNSTRTEVILLEKMRIEFSETFLGPPVKLS